jgi:4-amino-4-deoxy-L-arabinose transferase-like glycosyltransferase
MKRNSWLLIILLVALFLRIYNIQTVPIELFGDEVDVGIQANSILTTGNDYMGNPFPVMFRSFAEYRLPLQIYATVPFIKIFGLNELAVRLASIIAGVSSVLFLYLLVKENLDKRKALLAALLMSVSPWHVAFSRQANDAGFAIPFILLGTLFFIKGQKNFKLFLLSAVIFSLSFYSYAITTVFTPLYVVSLMYIYKSRTLMLSTRKLSLIIVVVLIVLLPYIKLTLDSTSTQRFSHLNRLTSEEVVRKVNDARFTSNSSFARLMNNKATALSYDLADKYISTLSVDFLFTKGDPNPRHSFGESGLLHRSNIIFLLAGLVYLVINLRKKSTNKFLLTLVFWLLLAPVPAILTQEGGSHAARLILMLPPLIILVSIGLDYLITNSKSTAAKAMLFGILIAAAFDITRSIHNYFVIWPTETWKYWHYGFKETLLITKSIDHNYERVYFTNVYEPMLQRYLFWYDSDMSQFQKEFTDDKHIPNLSNGFNGFKLGEKYYFGELPKPLENWTPQNSLIVASAEKDATNPSIFEDSNLRLVETIYSPHKTPVFYIYTVR